MTDSTHKKIAMHRKPRVHITMEVETEGAIKDVELPFRLGVMGDFTGDPKTPLKPLSERKFTSINQDNFDDVMERLSPALQFRVKNTLDGGESELPVDLEFKAMDDFEPAAVARQIGPIKDLLEERQKLKDLAIKVDLSPELEGILEKIVTEQDALEEASKQRRESKGEG